MSLNKGRRPRGINQLARYSVDRSAKDSGTVEINGGQQLSPEDQERQTIRRIMAEMGSKGGKIGGKRRAARMTPQQRSESASQAARTRWTKR
jgi:hypothetical protein